MRTPVEFWSNVAKGKDTECWEWQRSRFPKGYGYVWYPSQGDPTTMQQHHAQRIAYRLTFGDIPEGMLVCHSCDNPPCCNPAHLWLGTNAENTADRSKKGRTSRVLGKHRGNGKLTEEQVRDIRAEYIPGKVGYQALAKKFDVERSTIQAIVTRKTWAWLV